MNLRSIFYDDEGEPKYRLRLRSNETRPDGTPLPVWRQGRLSLGSIADAQWVFPSNRFGIGLRVEADGEDTVHLQWCVPPLEFYAGLDSWELGKRIGAVARSLGWCEGYDFAREVSVRIHSWAVWWTLWRDPNERVPRDRRNGTWHPFGRAGLRIGKAVDVETRDVEIPMPERVYRGRATKRSFTYRSESFPLVRKHGTSVEIEMFPGEQVPVPGKGENSWDCGDDAIFGATSWTPSIEEAVGRLVAGALRDRRRRAGSSWRPRPTEADRDSDASATAQSARREKAKRGKAA